MHRAKGYKKIVSSAEMQRIAERQRREYEADRQVVVSGSAEQRRALRKRNQKSVATVC